MRDWKQSWIDEGYEIKKLLDGSNVLINDWNTYHDNVLVYNIDNKRATPGEAMVIKAINIDGYLEYHNKKSTKGGFIKHELIEQEKRCNSPEHNPPGMRVLAPGRHTYQCPECGKETIINIPSITL